MKINTKNILMICLLFFVSPIIAQQTYDMQYGLKFGLNSATFGGKDGNGFRSATGMNIGGMLRKHITDMMYWEIDILISEKGALDNQDLYREQHDDTVNVEIVWSLNYFEVPVFVGFDFLNNTDASVHPILYGGGFIGYKTSSKLRGDYEDVTNEFGYNDVKSLDYGYVLGGSIEFDIHEDRLALDVRFTKSILSFDDSPYNLDYKNKVLTFSVGYYF
jgi:hypothetical protein